MVFGGCVTTGNTQGAKNAWRQTVARVVKSEMSVRGVKYQALSQRLEEIGVEQSADNLRNKVNFFPHNSKLPKLPDLNRLNNSYEIFHNKK